MRDRFSPATASATKRRSFRSASTVTRRFPGEGVVAETLNLSRLRGSGLAERFTSSSTIRLVSPPIRSDARSTHYASDLAKGFEVPIVHVNADDAECLCARRAPGDRVPRQIREGFPDRPRWIPPARAQRDGRAGLHAAYAVQADRAHPSPREVWGSRLVAEGVMTAGRSQSA